MLYAEDVNYWRTSRTSPDVWLGKARREITEANGTVLGEGFGSEPQTGRAAYMLAFEFGNERFKVIWPVLPSRGDNERAARIQAATMLYRDVKARCISAKVLGHRTAFFAYCLLPDGKAMMEALMPELLDAMPKLLTGGN